MLLRTKAVFTLCLLFSLFISLTYLIHQRIMIPHFLQLERQELETCMAINYGSWDDIYAFAEDSNEGFIESNLVRAHSPETKLTLLVSSAPMDAYYGAGQWTSRKSRSLNSTHLVLRNFLWIMYCTLLRTVRDLRGCSTARAPKMNSRIVTRLRPKKKSN